MSGFTVEDFAQATLATRGTLGVAIRDGDSRDERPWWTLTSSGVAGWRSDEVMAAEGWTPVVESRITEHTLRDSQEKADRNRQRLVDHIADQDRVIRRRNEELAALRERVRVAESGRLSLDRLEAAWEAAEPIDSTGIREGDLCIERCAERHFEVFRAAADAEVDGVPRSTIRILSRAPRPREPWQDLADDLAEVLDADARYSEGLARDLHNGGWRKGGEES